MTNEGPCGDPQPDRLTSTMCTRCAYPILEHAQEPESLWQPQRCRCGGTIRQQLMGTLICGECGRTP